MSEIPEIGINTIHLGIREISTFNVHSPLNIPQGPPVSLSIGSPIIELPGCVEYNSANKKSNILVDEDPKGNVILCDGTVPSYDPIDYTPENLVYTKEADVPMIPLDNNEIFKEPPPELPKETASKIICPPNDAPIVGSEVEGNKRISGYEIQDKRCVTLYEEIPIVEQVFNALPSAGAVTTTTSIAVVATTSAVLAKPLADLLLKVVKPAVKKAIGTIQTKLGRKPRKLSPLEIRANSYREKKGLPPLKELKKAH